MSVLDQIVTSTREVVKRRRRQVPPRQLEESTLFHHARRPFATALKQPGISIIAEIKKASPSRGVLRESVDVDDLATTYEEHGASAVSVLTEPEFFRGAPDDLSLARRATSLPLLRKDFIIDPYQLLEARAHGADAVLLIATVLDRSHLSDLLQAAEEIGLDHLVEVYRARELDRIDFDRVRVIGANNRDLDTFEVDVRRAGRILKHAPAGLVRVAESGIKTREDVTAAADDGADAVLVGEALMTSEDPGAALAALLAPAAEEDASSPSRS